MSAFEQISNLSLQPFHGNVASQGPMMSPLVTRERFAEMVGLPVGVIVGWCNKGLVPCVTVGKYSLINVALIGARCMQTGGVA